MTEHERVRGADEVSASGESGTLVGAEEGVTAGGRGPGGEAPHLTPRSMLPEGLPVLEDLSKLDAGLSETSEGDEVAHAERREELGRILRDRLHPSAMLEKMNFLLRFIGSVLFAHVLFEQRCVDNIRDADRRGTVVYIMQTRSLLDYLYFNYAFLKHGLPTARFSNDLRVTWLHGFWFWLGNAFRRHSRTQPEVQLEALVSHGSSGFVFLERPRQEPQEAIRYSQKFLHRLVKAQRQSAAPIFVIPMLLVWEKRPNARRPTFVDDLFGTAQSPGFFRKAIHYMQTVWQSFLRLGQPMVQVSSSINMQEFLREYPGAGTADSAELLRERLLEHLAQERHVIMGPVGESTHRIYKDITQRPEFVEALQRISAQEGVSEEVLGQKARKQFEEIAAHPSLLMIKIFSAFLSLVWYRIYDGFEVDEAGLERVREAAKSSNIVLIPSHKSHIDYLVISYIFYNYGLITPLIAAGVNLSFWPLGWFFRRSGAFFIRRSFKGDSLYPVVFREYLIRMLEESYPVEFFIEGTRSRTGKLIKPKYGMLEMIVRAWLSGRVESIKLVPISVGYEKIIEEKSYRNEVLGGEKAKESLSGLLQAPKFLASKYGRLYVEFDEPIDLETYMSRYNLSRQRAPESEVDELVVRLGHRIIYDINRATTVSPTALAATVLLNNAVRGCDRERFLQEVGFVLHFLTQPERAARLSGTLRDALQSQRHLLGENPESPDLDDPVYGGKGLEVALGQAVVSVMDRALSLFADNAQVQITREDGEVFYSLAEEHRLELSFYRNTIVHHFVPEALLATAALRFGPGCVPWKDLMEETRFLSRLFKYEWIYEERAEFENVFSRTLQYFERSSWITTQGMEESGEVAILNPITELHFFRRLLLSFLEGYAIVFGMLPDLAERRWEQGELANAALKRGRNDYLRGRILFYESLSKPTFTNAIRLLVDWGVLAKSSEPGRKREMVYYQVSPSWREGERHLELKRRLWALVYGTQELSLPRIHRPSGRARPDVTGVSVSPEEDSPQG